jgi:hypothetical protein
VIAFVLNHPAITAALIGPRTMEQLESQLVIAIMRRRLAAGEGDGLWPDDGRCRVEANRCGS